MAFEASEWEHKNIIEWKRKGKRRHGEMVPRPSCISVGCCGWWFRWLQPSQLSLPFLDVLEIVVVVSTVHPSKANLGLRERQKVKTTFEWSTTGMTHELLWQKLIHKSTKSKGFWQPCGWSQSSQKLGCWIHSPLRYNFGSWWGWLPTKVQP